MNNAKTWIGDSQRNDRLDLAAIRSSLPAEAGWLKNALDDSTIGGLFVQRRSASTDAANAQWNFRAASLVAIIGTTVGTLASGLLLYGAGADAPGSGGAGTSDPTFAALVKDKHLIITWVQIVGLFVAAAATALLGSRNFVGQWAENRRQAELQRREVFTTILELASEEVHGPLSAADPTNPVRQALEFFRRYQLDLQIAFYRKSGARHGSRSGVLEWITALLAALAAITGALGGLGASGAVFSAFLGIAVPIFLSGAQSWRAASRDTDKAAAYDKARKELEKAHLDLSAVERAADGADAAAVKAYFDRVHLIMASENEAWVPAANVAARG